ncbi:regulatory protein [Dysgonomonas sp. PH5-45]|uniref:regulatory protein RecX n=1 Tax=unclassified Dysgonomonas TaxID=2630389 RepID=UPI002474D203|nr:MULTISPECIES: regulatory protein RecX [unclassified Dysgonomonas]MDH6354159.1 regulatory protein [Dysgonomonas sp. PH5-45]MDH6386990.1 regulatory protein [Dysgonomonas sp. PH5-37]
MKLTEGQALAKIAGYCSKAERCEFDVRKKLNGWELTAEEQERIVSRLKKENFLNDKRFCQSFARDKARFNKWGKVKIAFELKRKKIQQAFIDECLSELDDADLIESLTKILETKLKSVKAKNSYELRGKLMRFALGRGFTAEQITKAMKGMVDEDCEEHI